MAIDHELLKTSTEKSLKTLAEKIGNTPDPKHVSYEFKFSDLISLDELQTKLMLEKLFGNKYRSIYSIQLTAAANNQEVWDALNYTKKEKIEGRAYSRVHDFNDSQHIYAGSSKTLSKRLLEHLGFGNKGTYALNIRYWCEHLNGGFTIDALIYLDLSQEVLCALEDQLSHETKPMFGRRGSV